MRSAKRNLIVLVMVAAMLLLSACGMKAEDAKAYTQAVMDASYKGEFKAYMEQTDSTEKEAKELYEGNMDATMKTAGFDNLGLSEELTANYRQLFLDMAKQAKYEVGEAKEDGKKAFTVDITIEPFTGFDGIQEEVTKVVTEEVMNLTEIPAQSEINELMFQKMYELMAERVKNPTYGEAQVVTVHVQPNSDNIYYVQDEDMTEVDALLFPSDNF